MQELSFYEFKEKTLERIQEIVKICKGTAAGNGMNYVLDPLTPSRVLAYTKNEQAYMTVGDLLLLAIEADKWCNVSYIKSAITSIIKKSQKQVITNLTGNENFILSEDLYDEIEADWDEFINKKIPLCGYQSSFCTDFSAQKLESNSILIFNHPQLVNMLMFEMKEKAEEIKQALDKDDYSILLLGRKVVFTKEERIHGLLNSLLDETLFSRFCILWSTNYMDNQNHECDIIQSYINEILSLLFNEAISIEEFEKIYLQESIETFLNIELEQYLANGIYAILKQKEFKLNFIKEGLVNVVSDKWNLNLKELNMKSRSEQYLQKVSKLETVELSDEEEQEIIIELLKINPVNKYLWNYLYGRYSEERKDLDKIVYLFGVTTPSEEQIQAEFFMTSIPCEYNCMGFSGVVDYLQIIELDECYNLQDKLQVALTKYQYENHELERLIDHAIKFKEGLSDSNLFTM